MRWLFTRHNTSAGDKGVREHAQRPFYEARSIDGSMIILSGTGEDSPRVERHRKSFKRACHRIMTEIRFDSPV